MNIYETIFICPGDISQEKIDLTLEKVKSIITRANGKVNSSELWGRKKLAYPIQRFRDGFYVYMTFSAPPETPAQLEHHFRVTDTILRSLTVKLDPRHIEKMKSQAKAASEETAVLSEATAPSIPTIPKDAQVPTEIKKETSS